MNNQQQYIKGLHGLRFFCALLVLIFHCNDALNQVNSSLFTDLNILKKGERAVDYFFILSGFLITYLALFEFHHFNGFDIKKFYTKRITRIFPLYYLSVALGFLLIGFLYPLIYEIKVFEFSLQEGLLKYIFFLPNLVAAEYSNVGPLRSLWSIGVEEQFYLFFPLLLFGFTKKRRGFLIAITVFCLSFFIYLLIQKEFLLDNATFSNFFTKFFRIHFIFLGCLIGVLFYYHKLICEAFLKHKLIQLLIWLSFILMMFLPNAIDDHNLFSGILFSLIILLFATNNSPINLEYKVLVKLGMMSYGIYIFHPYVSIILRFLMQKNSVLNQLIYNFPIAFYVIVFILTIIISNFSYKYFERYFLKLR